MSVIPPNPLPPLPSWSDAASVASYLTSVLALVFGVVALLHPGFTEPAEVQSLVPIAATVIAGLVQAVGIIAHRSVQKAYILAAVR